MLCLFGALVATTAAATPPSPPLHEPWLDDTSDDCATQWDGDCEVGWIGIGAADSLQLVKGSNDETGVAIVPGTSTPNGLSKTFSVTASGQYRSQAVVAALAASEGSGEVMLEVRSTFFDSSSNVVQSASERFAISTERTLTWLDNAPSGAEVLQLDMEWSSASGAATMGIIIDFEIIETPGNESCQDLPLLCPPCNISCQPGYSLSDPCYLVDEPPTCFLVEGCRCLPNGSSIPAEQTEGYWGLN